MHVYAREIACEREQKSLNSNSLKRAFKISHCFCLGCRKSQRTPRFTHEFLFQLAVLAAWSALLVAKSPCFSRAIPIFWCIDSHFHWVNISVNHIQQVQKKSQCFARSPKFWAWNPVNPVPDSTLSVYSPVASIPAVQDMAFARWQMLPKQPLKMRCGNQPLGVGGSGRWHFLTKTRVIYQANLGDL